MGFYFRKSIKVGPLKFNLSKSGIGVSTGVKGFRVGTGPRGNYVHMGRGGLYYRVTVPSDATHTSRLNSNSNHNTPAATAPDTPLMHELESGSIDQMQPSSANSLLSEINRKRQLPSYARTAIAASISAILLSVISGFAGLAMLLLLTSGPLYFYINLRDKLRKTTVLIYDLSDEALTRYQKFYEAFELFATMSAAWHVESAGRVSDIKRNAGATTVLRNQPITIQGIQPKWLQVNFDVPSLAAGEETLCFLPDFLLVSTEDKVGAIEYSNLEILASQGHFIIEGTVPEDAIVTGKTWQFPNKKGGPDKRYKVNRELPIANYGYIRLNSQSGLSEFFQLSNPRKSSEFAEALLQFVESANFLASLDAERKSNNRQPKTSNEVSSKVEISARPSSLQENIRNKSIQNQKDEVAFGASITLLRTVGLFSLCALGCLLYLATSRPVPDSNSQNIAIKTATEERSLHEPTQEASTAAGNSSTEESHSDTLLADQTQGPNIAGSQCTVNKIVDSFNIFDLGDFQQNIDELEILPKPITGDDVIAEPLNQAGVKALKLKSFTKAVNLFNGAAKANPSVAKYFSNLGFAEMFTGNLDSATEHTCQSIMLDPHRAIAWNNLGQIFAKSGDSRRSLACFKIGYFYSRGDSLSYLQSLAKDDDAAIRNSSQLAVQELSPNNAAEQSPEGLVEELYKAHQTTGSLFTADQKRNAKNFPKFFDDKLSSLLLASVASNKLDVDPLFDSQGATPHNIKIDTIAVEGDTATVKVLFIVQHEQHQKEFQLRRFGSAWRIANVLGTDGTDWLHEFGDNSTN